MSAIDAEGRCRHWHGPDDVLWLRLACCHAWWPCRTCHDEAADHDAQSWPGDGDDLALRCGRCQHVFPIQPYFAGGHPCPGCGGQFNAGCQRHRALYVDDKPFKAAR